MKNVKQKTIEVLPYVAVFGVAAIAVYGIAKIVRSVKDMDFPLDFGNDPYLRGMRGE
jgi:hypothetical protein